MILFSLEQLREAEILEINKKTPNQIARRSKRETNQITEAKEQPRAPGQKAELSSSRVLDLLCRLPGQASSLSEPAGYLATP